MNTPNTILIIDDDRFMRQLLELTLQLEGFRVLQAADGNAAKQWVSEENIDLIVLDLMMPDLDGLGFLQWLRKEQHKTIPVLVQTAMSREDTRATALEAGADELIFKPYNVEALIELVKPLMQRNKN